MSRRLRIDTPMAQLPLGRKTILDGWWRRDADDIPPGTTLLARHLKREWRAKRGFKRQDERLQHEWRGRAFDVFEAGEEWLWPAGHA